MVFISGSLKDITVCSCDFPSSQTDQNISAHSSRFSLATTAGLTVCEQTLENQSQTMCKKRKRKEKEKLLFFKFMPWNKFCFSLILFSVRNPEGRIRLYCKGADTVLLERLHPCNQELMNITSDHLNVSGLYQCYTAI